MSNYITPGSISLEAFIAKNPATVLEAVIETIKETKDSTEELRVPLVHVLGMIAQSLRDTEKKKLGKCPGCNNTMNSEECRKNFPESRTS